MQIIDHDVPVADRDEPLSPASETRTFAAVRFNALKHGVLSRYTVLPHEDREEYEHLFTALVMEHQPDGATESHLVEELAGIIWRKRRVLMAEGARINEGLWNAANSPKRVMPAAAPFEQGLSGENADLSELLTATPDEVAERQRHADIDLKATRRAAEILLKGGPNAYRKAQNVLIPETRAWWNEHVEAEEYPDTAEGLAAFIHEALEPLCTRIVKEVRYQPHIKAQTLGEGLQAHQLLALNRYETHLDRKFERTLAMLLKLKALRGA
jgi:hypothetical protein